MRISLGSESSYKLNAKVQNICADLSPSPFLFLYVCLLVCLSISLLSICLSVYLSAYFYACLPVHLLVSLSTSMTVCLSVYLFVYLLVCMSDCQLILYTCINFYRHHSAQMHVYLIQCNLCDYNHFQPLSAGS